LNRPTERLFAPVEIETEHRADGAIILRNCLRPAAATKTLPEILAAWAKMRPDQIFISQPATGGRRVLTYAQTLAFVDDWAARLLTLDLSVERPLMIIGVNSINHALLMLAATSVGIPVAVVSPPYVGPSAAPYGKFQGVLGRIAPGLIVSDTPEDTDKALALLGFAGAESQPLGDMDWLEARAPADTQRLAAAKAEVSPDTIAKLLFTSGSTGAPKAVINTQRMMVSNMLGLGLVWRFLQARAPVLVDWLPWSHTFGGNACFNLALFYGGSYHIDDGKPLPALIGKTIDSLKAIAPTIYFNVPSGYEALLPFLENDAAFAAQFFANLDVLFNAGAALPTSVRRRLEAAAAAAIGRCPPIIGAWGSTETAPFSTVIYFETPHASNLGVPLPGTEIKLVPRQGRTEMRVRGPNVMPGYWRQPEATAAAFDDEGFYQIGDAGVFADTSRPQDGILFDGRVAENFKLSSGTWVNVGALRLAVVAALSPMVSDVVVAGEGRDDIRLLLFANEGACRSLLGEAACARLEHASVVSHPQVRDKIAGLLVTYNADQIGSSTRVGRFQILDEPPSARDGELTDKGYLNQRAVLARRAKLVDQLFAEQAAPAA